MEMRGGKGKGGMGLLEEGGKGRGQQGSLCGNFWCFFTALRCGEAPGGCELINHLAWSRAVWSESIMRYGLRVFRYPCTNGMAASYGIPV